MTSIQLDREFQFRRIEVEDESPDGMLAAKLPIAESSTSKPGPDAALSACWLATHATRETAHSLARMCHGSEDTSEWLECNRLDDANGRKVWYQFRETQLTFERSWLARLRYTHQNAVHHRLVSAATQYRWCSASWFESNARPAFVKVVNSFKVDRINVPDDFDVVEP